MAVEPTPLRVGWHVYYVSICVVFHVQIVKTLFHPHIETDPVGSLLSVIGYIVEFSLLFAVNYDCCAEKAG